MTRVIAHRGFAGEAPENTLPAIRRASRLADAVEVDVRRCASGEPVVIHDATVDRVTDSTGRVSDLSRSELASLSVLGSEAGVPTLREVLDACPSDVTLHVELKEVGVAADVLELIRNLEEVVVSSFLDDALRTCRETGVALAYLHAEPGGIERAVELGCEYVHPRHDLIDRDFLERARAAGLTVNAWTIREESVATRLREVGVDGLIADVAEFS